MSATADRRALVLDHALGRSCVEGSVVVPGGPVPEVLNDGLALRLGTDHFADTRWMYELLDGESLPFADLSYDVVPGQPAEEGPQRWAITGATLSAVDSWLDGGDPHAPISGCDEARKALALLLWGHGCGVSTHSEWRRSSRRRAMLQVLMPTMPLAVDAIVSTNVAGLDRHEILTGLAHLQQVGGIGVLGLATKVLSPQAVGQLLRHADRNGAIRTVRVTMTERTSTVARVRHDDIKALRTSLRNVRLSPDSDRFAREQLRRAAHRRLVSLRRPSTDHGIAELESLAQVHRIIGALMTHHPATVDRSASLYPINEIPVYGDGNYRAGHPSGLPLRDDDGSIHPKVRSATRTPDGAVWTAWDAPDQPSIFVEFEAAPGNVQLEAHVETALWASSRWRKPITLVVGTTTSSHVSVRNALTWMGIDDIATKFRHDWPGADVTVRLVKAHTLAAECPLHGDGAEDFHFSAGRGH